ncbi:isoaspartyl dipeptidase [Reinekea sp. MED297]|uniref:Isoaspartyl dipeptidase n=2 Tax=Reinekea TaxID=230494 RepID=A4BJ16_9GAMM|nr:isoaspartyl dipeptidase [Reinekea sp. MED297] [Reinekea blandensis MED297]
MHVLRNARVYAPDDLGCQDILIGGGVILAIAPDIQTPKNLPITETDCRQAIVCPGFVDTLTHITGGGGEGGFATRTPEMQVSDAVKGGVTTVTGALGTDAVCRTHQELVAKVKALRDEGLSAYFYTGNYHYPVKTLTGSVQQDIMLIDECIGIGEIAIADHRGSQMSWRELARVAADARVGGLCSGKAGIVSVHVGDGDDRLSTLFDVAEHSNIPLSQFYPTHINRSPALLNDAVRFAALGGSFDLTASSTPEILASGELKCAQAFKLALEQGVSDEQITFSTDGHASLPHFNSDGVLESLKVGSMTSLLDEVRDAVLIEQLPLSQVLKAVTANPARILKLDSKGRIAENADADLLVLNPDDLTLQSVMAGGQWFMQDGNLTKVGTFE